MRYDRRRYRCRFDNPVGCREDKSDARGQGKSCPGLFKLELKLTTEPSTQATKADGASRRAASVLSIPTRLAQITSQEGVKALFAGVVPRTMWISLGGAVFLGAYDLVSDPFQIKM